MSTQTATRVLLTEATTPQTPAWWVHNLSGQRMGLVRWEPELESHLAICTHSQHPSHSTRVFIHENAEQAASLLAECWQRHELTVATSEALTMVQLHGETQDRRACHLCGAAAVRWISMHVPNVTDLSQKIMLALSAGLPGVGWRQCENDHDLTIS